MKNLDEFVVSKLGTLDALAGRIFPTAALVGDTVPPFALFRVTKEDVQRDLDGVPGVRTATVRIEIFDDDNDRLCTVLEQAEMAMAAADEDLDDMYIYSSFAQRGDEDDMDLTLDLLVKNLTATVIYAR